MTQLLLSLTTLNTELTTLESEQLMNSVNPLKELSPSPSKLLLPAELLEQLLAESLVESLVESLEELPEELLAESLVESLVELLEESLVESLESPHLMED